MQMFDVQGIEIKAPGKKVFEFLRVPENLPRWAQAFTLVGNGQARLETPAGGVDVALDVSANAEAGTVDWELGFPDGGVALAQPRRPSARICCRVVSPKTLLMPATEPAFCARVNVSAVVS